MAFNPLREVRWRLKFKQAGEVSQDFGIKILLKLQFKGNIWLKELTSLPANENTKYGSTNSFISPPNKDFLICSPTAESTARNLNHGISCNKIQLQKKIEEFYISGCFLYVLNPLSSHPFCGDHILKKQFESDFKCIDIKHL